MKNYRLGLFGAALLLPVLLWGQIPQTPNPGPSTEVESESSDSILVTIILKHQQNRNLQELRRVLEAQGFWDMFPPEEAKVLSWNIAMGLGHVIVLQVPAGSVRYLNLSIENGAWGAFDTEVYLSYDYKSVWQEHMEMRGETKADRD
jgi:hypothetical protein